MILFRCIFYLRKVDYILNNFHIARKGKGFRAAEEFLEEDGAPVPEGLCYSKNIKHNYRR